MLYDNKIWVGTGEDHQPALLLPQMANRHGLIAGATGTGKTVTLKVMAEGFSDMGVPVFLGDIKGDLSGMVKPGEQTDQVTERLIQTGVPILSTTVIPLFSGMCMVSRGILYAQLSAKWVRCCSPVCSI